MTIEIGCRLVGLCEFVCGFACVPFRVRATGGGPILLLVYVCGRLCFILGPLDISLLTRSNV